MAALSADIAAIFDPRFEIGLMQRPASATDIYYRGGLAHELDAGTGITLTPVDADFYAGVVMEHKSATAADMVWIGTFGHWFFTCSNFSAANYNLNFCTQAATLFDNPADLDVTQAAADPGIVGILLPGGGTAGTNGWLNTNMRQPITNA
jgi:hypothetical protein